MSASRLPSLQCCPVSELLVCLEGALRSTADRALLEVLALVDVAATRAQVVDDEDTLFLSLQGRRMTERQIRTLVKKYTSIGMKTGREGGYSPHKLRATTATSLISRGNSIFNVATL